MITSFHPPRRTLLGPGPSDVDPRILEALSRQTIGHLDPAFISLMDELKELLQFAFQTRNQLTMPISAPGSAGMESVFVNLLEPGDKAIVCINGVFGGRMVENVLRCGAIPILVENNWGEPVDPQRVEDALRANADAKLLAFVHAETSTGVRSDARTLAALAARYSCLCVVDAVTSLGGIELDVDGWGIDAVYSGSQKCLSCIPGISPVSFSDRAVETIRNRSSKVQSWFLDTTLIMAYWGGDAGRSYHHTAPVNSLYALHEALVILQEEGLPQAWQRHARHHAAFATGIEAMGLGFVVETEWRLPQLNAVLIPQGVDEAEVRKLLLRDHSIEIGAGLGAMAGKIWRIGLMGYGCSQRNVLQCLAALDEVLLSLGAEFEPGRGAVAAAQFYRSSAQS